MKHIYCISGLAADEKMFSKFEFGGYEIHYVNWIIPEVNESIAAYAKRIKEQIIHENPILIGLSFGGIISIEIAKQIKTELVIIISSIKFTSEIPLWMRLSGKFKMNRLFKMKPYKVLQPFQDYNLGIKTTEEKKLVHEYRKTANLVYINWAINAILNWKNDVPVKNLYHIHGDNDRIFSVKKIKADHIIKGGGHLMILNKSSEVNQYINTILQKHV